MHDHYDHNQTLVPESFLAIHSRHGRALKPRAEIEARYELCEDVALHAASLLAARHQVGDDTSPALRRCHDGLRSDPQAFAAAEAAWIVQRVAELQEWDAPHWLADTETGNDGNGNGHGSGNGNRNSSSDSDSERESKSNGGSNSYGGSNSDGEIPNDIATARSTRAS